MVVVQAKMTSSTWSRSLTASRLLRVAPDPKPSSDASASRSTGYAVPASAAEPSGQVSMRDEASARRSASRASIST